MLGKLDKLSDYQTQGEGERHEREYHPKKTFNGWSRIGVTHRFGTSYTFIWVILFYSISSIWLDIELQDSY